MSTALAHPQHSAASAASSAAAIQKQPYDPAAGMNSQHTNGTSGRPAAGENGGGGHSNAVAVAKEEPEEEAEPEVDIVINNVVCSFNVRCHLNLRDIALRGLNVEYRKENGMVTMKLRHPYTTASMWSSGKITCTGANSEDQAKTAARKYARFLQKLGFNTRFRNYRVVNVLGTCTMPFAIKIAQFSQEHREASYEPELHPGVTYRIRDPKATLKIFSTGSITITAPCVANIQSAVERIYPLVHKFRKPKTADDIRIGTNVPLPPAAAATQQRQGLKRKMGGGGHSSSFNKHQHLASLADDDDDDGSD